MGLVEDWGCCWSCAVASCRCLVVLARVRRRLFFARICGHVKGMGGNLAGRWGRGRVWQVCQISATFPRFEASVIRVDRFFPNNDDDERQFREREYFAGSYGGRDLF